MGIAYSKLRTPLPTKPTIVAVVTEEDCTNTVHKIPTSKPAKGLETDSKSASVYSAPKVLMPFSRSLIDTRKKYKKNIAKLKFLKDFKFIFLLKYIRFLIK